MLQNTSTRAGATCPGTISCHNLRPARMTDAVTDTITGRPTNSSCMRPVGRPERVAPAARSIGFVGGGTVHVIISGLQVAAIPRSTRPKEPKPVATLDSPMQCARISGNKVTVYTSKGAFLLIYDPEYDTWQVPGYPAMLPPIAFGIGATSAISASVPSRTLSSATSLQHIADADIRTLTSDLTAAYRFIAERASANGYAMQPYLAFYRLVDHAGHVVYQSPVSLLSHSSGSQLTQQVSLKTTDSSFSAVNSYSITADVFRGCVHVTAADNSYWAAQIARADIYVSPQFHPYDPSAGPDLHPGRNSSAGTIYISLPGAASVLTSLTSPSAHSVIASLCDRTAPAFRLFSRTISIDNPFAAARTVSIPALSTDFTTQVAAIKKALRTSVAPASDILSRISSPHSFYPCTVCEASGAILYAGITTVPFSGYHPSAFAATTVDMPWRAAITTVFTDGTRITRTASGDTRAPDTFNPLLAYPSSSAACIEIRLQRQGEKMRYISLPLQPLSSGSASLYTHDSLRPFSIAECDDPFVVPADTIVLSSIPNLVAVAAVDTPEVISAATMVDSSEIYSLLPAQSSTGAWDYGRARFYAFGSGGIHTVTASASHTSLAVNNIDRRPVTSPFAAVLSDGGTVVAVAGSDLIEISRSKVSTLIPDFPYSFLGWNSMYRELWCLSPSSDTAAVICYDFGKRLYTAYTGESDCIFSHGMYGMYISRPDGLYICGLHPTSQVDVRFSRNISVAAGDCLSVPLSASAVTDGSITLTHRHLSGFVSPLFSATFNGILRAPLRFPLFLPYKKPVRCRLDLTATVSPDARLYII